MKDWYQKDEQEILKELHVTKEGLTAGQAETLLLEKGENVLMEGKKKSVLAVFAEQFCDLLVVILIAAAVISMFSGNVESTIVIVAVIILNAVLGTVQHEKAKKSLESLKSLSSPNAKVIRGGQKIEVPSAKVVPGDILLLEAGDMVVADGRILNNYSLQVNESSLTGESTNVDKEEGTIDSEMPLADRTNMVYSGSLVTYGRAMVVVTGTGMDTEIGKIASLMNATKEKKTPLQVSLDLSLIHIFKIHGLTRPIIEEAIRRTREARIYILDEVMAKAIAEPRTEVGKYSLTCILSPMTSAVCRMMPLKSPPLRFATENTSEKF